MRIDFLEVKTNSGVNIPNLYHVSGFSFHDLMSIRSYYSILCIAGLDPEKLMTDLSEVRAAPKERQSQDDVD